VSSTKANDSEVFALIKEKLYTPVIGDILDQMGYMKQFLPFEIQPMRESMKVVGRAMTVVVEDVSGFQAKPFGLLTEALDQIEDNEIYLARGAQVPCAAWGEIMTATAKKRGCVGAVVDGFHRDTPQMLEMNFPIFSRGNYAQDSGPRAAVKEFRVPVKIGQVDVKPGDIVFGDMDGVLIIPQDIESEVIEKSLDKASTENTVRNAIENGMSATEAFATYGVL
jgi:4-hydroxy-4-methyl-2-oxoglutarate aldolase